MAIAAFLKDPEAYLDYSIDWAEWLEDDVIIGSEWSTKGDLKIERDSYTDTITTVWLTGGPNSSRHDVTNTITTAGGRIDERTIVIKCRHK